MDSQSSDASTHGRDEFSAILNRAIHGNSHSRSALFEQIQPKLELYLSQQSGLNLRRKIQIEDMCQDVFLRALKVLTTLPEEATQQDFLNLVLKNAHWTVLDAVKKNERFKGESNIPGGIVSVPLDPDAHGGEALIIEREESEWLHGLVERLDESYSSVLWLKLDGLETAEVSERLGISQDLVRKRYQRAIEKLKQFTDR